MTVTIDEKEFTLINEQINKLKSENEDLKHAIDSDGKDITIGYIRHIIKLYADKEGIPKILLESNETDTEGVIRFKSSVSGIKPLLQICDTPNFTSSEVDSIINRIRKIFNR